MGPRIAKRMVLIIRSVAGRLWDLFTLLVMYFLLRHILFLSAFCVPYYPLISLIFSLILGHVCAACLYVSQLQRFGNSFFLVLFRVDW